MRTRVLIEIEHEDGDLLTVQEKHAYAHQLARLATALVVHQGPALAQDLLDDRAETIH